ncbi:MAG: septum site-determining protein MinC [Azoarcus sp.]|jgi:septum site-determining protein MinC|nr:septum site-determining protein MinC [Azoarcus sp.]
MSRSAPVRSIEFHPFNLSALRVVLDRADPAGLADELHKMLGGRPDRFSGEAAILDFSALETLPARIDWNGLTSLLRRYCLQPVGVYAVDEEHAAAARNKASLALFEHLDATPVSAPAPRASATTVSPFSLAAPDSASPPQADLPFEPSAAAPLVAGASVAPTLYIDRPVRSGQQVYAHGGDLVLLAGVSPGAEVIADGNIHCFGPLLGRALAGARGNAQARVISTHFSPELVSIAGVYRTFEQGVPEAFAARAVVVRMKSANGSGQTISIDPLQLD